MTFTQFCVGLVISLATFVVCGGLGLLIASGVASHDDNDWLVAAFGVSSIGFGICLTILLYQNGII